MTVKVSFIGAVHLTILLAVSAAYAQAENSIPVPAKDIRFSRDTPEGTLRLFMLGVLLCNEQLLKSTIVPVSEDDMSYLLQKTKGLQDTPAELKEVCGRMTVRVLKPGDIVTLPGGKKVTVSDEEVTDEEMVVVLGDSPVPTRLYKAKGFWWVDAGPVIAGRKAAAKLRQEASTDQPAETADGPQPRRGDAD